MFADEEFGEFYLTPHSILGREIKPRPTPAQRRIGDVLAHFIP
jgi:hypothetical protein